MDLDEQVIGSLPRHEVLVFEHAGIQASALPPE